MSLAAKLRRAPLRVATGAYILNSGVGKLGMDDEAAKTVHGAASNTYGFVGKMQPGMFTKVLGVGEIAVGSAVLLPIVPPVVAGAALVGFSGLLLNTYWQTPGMHEENSPRPTTRGAPVAKDVWMLGIGTGLIADALLEPAHDKRLELTATVAEKRAEKSRRAKRKAAKQAAKAGKARTRAGEQVSHGRAALAEVQEEAVKRARKAAKKGQKRARKQAEEAQRRAQKAAQQAREAARHVADEYGTVAAEKAKQARDAARNVVDEYGPVAAEKAKQARDAAQQARDATQQTAAKVKERVAS